MDDEDVVVVYWKVIVVGVVVVVYFIVGMFVLVCWEGLNFIDVFYVVCVIVIIFGYGDCSFGILGGCIFVVFWILLSIVSVG